MRHPVSRRLDSVSLRLLLPPVSFHLMKKFLILFHLMKIKSDSVSFHKNKTWFCFISLKKNPVLSHLTKKKTGSVLSHKKKILSHSDSVSNQNQNRTGNPDLDDLK